MLYKKLGKTDLNIRFTMFGPRIPIPDRRIRLRVGFLDTVDTEYEVKVSGFRCQGSTFRKKTARMLFYPFAFLYPYDHYTRSYLPR